jgi:hypothetical protein
MVVWLSIVSVIILAEMRLVGAIEQRLINADSGAFTSGLPNGSRVRIDALFGEARAQDGTQFIARASEVHRVVVFVLMATCPACRGVVEWLPREVSGWKGEAVVVAIGGSALAAHEIGRALASAGSAVYVMHDDGRVSGALHAVSVPLVEVLSSEGVVLAGAAVSDRSSVRRLYETAPQAATALDH